MMLCTGYQSMQLCLMIIKIKMRYEKSTHLRKNITYRSSEVSFDVHRNAKKITTLKSLNNIATIDQVTRALGLVDQVTSQLQDEVTCKKPKYLWRVSRGKKQEKEERKRETSHGTAERFSRSAKYCPSSNSRILSERERDRATVTLKSSL